MNITHKVDNEFFSGSIEISVPTYSERLRIMKELQFKVQEDGSVEKSSDSLEQSAKFVEKLGQYIKKVDLKIKKNSESISSFDTLGMYAEGASLIMELTPYISRGLTLGNA